MKLKGKSALAATALVATALVSIVSCSSSEGTKTETLNALNIVSAVYDDKGTDDGMDDELYVYLQKDIDDGSWSSASSAFNLSDGATIGDGAVLSYSGGSPYKVTVSTPLAAGVQLEGFQPNTTTISVNRGGFTIDTVDVTPGNTAVVTATQVVVDPADRNLSVDVLNETIIDNDLGVIWRGPVDDVNESWSTATTTCEDLEESGYDDWRLPTIYELLSTVDYRLSDPAIYTEFNLTTDTSFWSSTVAAYNDDYRWKVDFIDGGARLVEANVTRDARCVRGEPQPKHIFIAGLDDLGRNVVKDTNNGLIWDDSHKTESDENLTWQQAEAYCSGLGAPWRLPTVSELQSIVDYDEYNPSLDGAFSRENFNSSIYSYWTSTVTASNADNAWTIRFYSGRTIRRDKDSNSQTVRCVQ